MKRRRRQRRKKILLKMRLAVHLQRAVIARATLPTTPTAPPELVTDGIPTEVASPVQKTRGPGSFWTRRRLVAT